MNRKKIVRRGAVAGALGVAVLGVGLFLNDQANFSKNYVRDQLTEHQINFAPVERLKEQQKSIPCLVENAGKPLTTPTQAECYAKYQVGIDMLGIDGGRGYSQTRYASYLLKQKAAEAVANRPDDPATQALIKESAALRTKADDMLAGEAVKGLLLTAYGFGRLGELGGQAATLAFTTGGALLLAMAGSFILAATAGRRSRPGTEPAPGPAAEPGAPGRVHPAGPPQERRPRAALR